MRLLFRVLYSVFLYVIDIIIPSVIQGLLLNVRFVNFGLQNLSIVSSKVLLSIFHWNSHKTIHAFHFLNSSDSGLIM